MSSNFNFYVNRQGIQGVRGPKGEQGFSPIITVKTETAAEYVLKIENEDGSFDTPNLRGNALVNTGGSYVRYNPETSQMYVGGADSASTESAGEIRLSTYEELEAGLIENAVPSAMDVHEFVENSIDSISGFVTTSDFDTYTAATDSALSSLSTNKLNKSTYDAYVLATDSTLDSLSTSKLDFTDLTNTLVQGSNITLTTDALNKTITISATGGGGGGSSYTEGDGIDITSDVISVKVDGTTIDFNVDGELEVIGGGGGTQVQADWDESDPDDPSYIQNKPTIPAAANDATITITQGGVTKGTFTSNQSSDLTIALDAGGGASLSSGNGINISSLGAIDISQEDSTYVWNDITIVGTPTITDGVYGGFSENDYIYMNNYPSSVNLFEMQFDFITGTLNNTNQFLTYTKTGASWEDAPYIFVNSENKAVCRFYNNGSSVMFYSTSALSSNTEYILKLVFNGTTASCTIETGGTAVNMEDGDGNTSVVVSTVDFNDAIKIGMPSWTGGVRLDNSYIKVNGSYYGVTGTNPPAKATQSLYGLVKPDGETTTVNDGVISTVNTVHSTTVNNIVQITQAAYDLLPTKDSSTLYVIVSSGS